LASRMKVKKVKVGAGKENRVGKLKVETFSLLISILIHLGLLTAPFFLSPPKSAKYVKSIKVDYLISLPKINHHLRESSGKSILSPLTRVRKFPLLRKIEASVYLAREENLSRKRLGDHTPSLATEPVGLNQTLPLRQREFLLLPTEKNCYPYQILSSSLDPLVQPGICSYSPTIKEKKFSPLTTEPDSHREEIRTLKEDRELITESLWLREYGEKIRKLINANKKYPPVARQHGWKGKIKVRFMINSGGEVIKTEVLSPCSYEVLNRAAEKLIKDTSPFPSFPSSWHKNSLTLEVQVVYQLKESTLIKEDRD